MKKIIKNSILMILFLITIVCCIYGYRGFRLYERVSNQVSIDEKVNEVRGGNSYTKLESISDDFLNGIVSVEDHRFYDHGAVDFISIGRSVVSNLKAGHIVMGGSTITQQLAKNMFLSNEQSVERKIAEVIFASQLERKYTKDQILELYVNVIYFGDGYYGIANASEGYYNVEPSNLSFEQAVLLSGLPQSPENYSLSKHYDRAVERGQIVLDAMKENEVVESKKNYFSQLQYK